MRFNPAVCSKRLSGNTAFFAGVMLLLSMPGLARAATGHVSQGAINGNGAFGATFTSASANGTRVIFTTSEPLAVSDTDSSSDLYQRENGVTTHLSQGSINGNGAFGQLFRGGSSDGSRVFFTTGEPLAASDTDTSEDLYLRENGITTHVSQGAINGNGAFNVPIVGIFGDGSRAFFTTSEPLTATDTDTSTDLYLRENGVTTHVSRGAINGNGAFNVSFGLASADGSRAFFTTNEPLTATDTDTSTDLYLRDNGVTTHLSQGAINGNGAFDVNLRGVSGDGSRVYFTTSETLAATDTDAQLDLYQRENGVTIHLSQGAINGNGAFSVIFAGASTNGSRVYFMTNEPLATSDTDTSTDLYQRENGVTTHLSQGAINGNGAFNVSIVGAATDGSRVFFETSEPLAASDTDANNDLYLRENGVTIHVSRGAINGNGAFNVSSLPSISADGSRVFFVTSESLAVSDTDTSRDLYLRENGMTTHFSQGTINGNGAFDVGLPFISRDGSRAFFGTGESLAASDTDTSEDLYVSSLQVVLAVSKAGSGTGSVTSSPAGINCGGTCVFSYDVNTLVLLTPAADPNSSFIGWSGCDSVAGNVCNVAMTAAKTATATFMPAVSPRSGSLGWILLLPLLWAARRKISAVIG